MDLFYRLSKSFWALAAPGNLLVLWFIVAALFLLLGSKWARAGQRMVLGGAALALFVLCVPVGYWALAQLEERIPRPQTLPAEIAGIIVLGGSESEKIASARQPLYTNFANMNRLVVFKHLADRYPTAQLLYSGGMAHGDVSVPLRQADIVKAVLGVMMPEDREVLYESASRTTYENAVNSTALIGEARKQPWILVTSAWHMPRALGTFRQQGWNIIPMPADYSTEGGMKPLWQIDFLRNMQLLNITLREIFGMFGYYWGGKTDALFPEWSPAP